MDDATNILIIFAGELLKKSESLLILGLHPSEIISEPQQKLYKRMKVSYRYSSLQTII